MIPLKSYNFLFRFYYDVINVGRSLEKSVVFESSYFEDRASDNNGGSNTRWIVIVIVLAAGYWWWRRRGARLHQGPGHHKPKHQ